MGNGIRSVLFPINSFCSFTNSWAFNWLLTQMLPHGWQWKIPYVACFC